MANVKANRGLPVSFPLREEAVVDVAATDPKPLLFGVARVDRAIAVSASWFPPSLAVFGERWPSPSDLLRSPPFSETKFTCATPVVFARF